MLTVVACGGAASGTTTPTSPSTGSVPTEGPSDHMDVSSLPPSDRSIVEAAVADLAETASVPPEEIEVVSFERVTWSDGSLGCPQPGMLYTQALVDGSLTVLELDAVQYRYHAGTDDRPFLCDSPLAKPATSPPPPLPPGDK